MLRHLSRGAATSSAFTADVARCSSYSGSVRPLTLSASSSALPRRKRQLLLSSALSSEQNSAECLRAPFHSDSYFSSSPPNLPSLSSATSVSTTDPTETLSSERYLPPLLDVPLVAKDEAQHILLKAIADLDADRSWHLYNQLGKARLALSSHLIDLILTLQCRKPVRSSPGNIRSRAAVGEVCDRLLRLCQDRLRCQVGSSVSTSSSSDKFGLVALSPALSLRLLYLLVVEEEQIAAARSAQPPPKRKHLSCILETLSAKIDSHQRGTVQLLEIQLRGRLAATLSRLGSTDAAYHHLSTLVDQAFRSEEDLLIDPRPFDQLLSALTRQRMSRMQQRPQHLPSPLDSASITIDQDDPILRALHLTLLSQVEASKASIHRCLQALDTSTLWWLLPFELQGSCRDEGRSKPSPDDRFALTSKWHPWQTSPDGRCLSADLLESLAERVALVLAQRGILQPALHIIDGLQTLTGSSNGANVSGSNSNSDGRSQVTSKVPDHDLFTVVLEQLADRMYSNLDESARKSLDAHRGLSLDMHLAMKVYSIAHTVGVDLDLRINEAVIKAFSACLPTSVLDLGPARAQFSTVKPNIAQRNEARGSRHALQVYLQHFTDMILAKDPDLSKGSLSFPAQATLLGLHMRTRDFASTKRLYELVRLREPDREFWLQSPGAGSLKLSALHPLAGPDNDTFRWLFVESLRSLPNPYFAVRLYLDWLASGNTLPSRITAIFVKVLLRAGLTSTVQRVLQELHQDHAFLPARLARSLVASFAEAGFPDIAVELATNVSQITAATTSFKPVQEASPHADETSIQRDSWLLGSTLNLISIALDRSSKAIGPTDVDLHRKVFRLFDEFRIGLTHQLLRAMTATDPKAGTQLHSLSLADVRNAYNAIMKVRLLTVSEHRGGDASVAGQQLEVDWKMIKSTCGHVAALFDELKDLGAEPDKVSWDLRLKAGVHACLHAPTLEERTHWLQQTIKSFKQSCKSESRMHDALPGFESKVSAVNFRPAAASRSQKVKVLPAVVSSLIDACRRCNDFTSGIQVYETHLRQNGFNASVEKEKHQLLAAWAEPGK